MRSSWRRWKVGSTTQLHSELESDFETFTAPYGKNSSLFSRMQFQILMHIWQTLYSTPTTHSSTGYGTCGSSGTLKHGLWHIAGIINGILWSWRSLSDKIKMQGWAPEVEVNEVMNTEGDLLCYRY